MHNKQTKPNARVSRRRFLIGTAGALGAALSACVVPQAQPASAPVAPTPASANKRTVEGVLGNIYELSGPPNRLHVGTGPDLDSALVVGIIPNSIEIYSSANLRPDQSAAASAQLIRYSEGPNLEALALAKPDLIISGWGKEEYQKRMAEIAPTIQIPQGSWSEVARGFGRIYFKEAEMEAVIASLEKRFASFRERLAARKGQTPCIVYTSNGTEFTMMTRDSSVSQLMVELGFAPLKKTGNIYGEKVSLEGLTTEAQGDFLVLLADSFRYVDPNQPVPEDIQKFLNSPLAQKLPAAKGGIFLYPRDGNDVYYFTVMLIPIFVDLLEKMLIGEGEIAPAATTASAATYPRTIKDGAGIEVTIPAKPRRIAVLDPLWSLEGLLSLGVAPVLIGQRSFVQNFNGGDPLKHWPWLEDALTKLNAKPERMNADTTNVEVVAQAKPDLIIGMPNWVDESRELLNGIAPTVQIPLKGGVGAAITLLGQALGMEAEATEVIAEWNRRIETEVKGLVPPGKTAAIIRTDGEGTFTVFNTQGYGPYDMFTQMGFGVPEPLAAAPKNDNGLGSNFSLEKLDVLDPADVIIVLGFSVDATDELLKNPLFTRIPAVKAGRVLRIAQGPIAQGLAAQSPLNLDALLNEVKKAAEFVR